MPRTPLPPVPGVLKITLEGLIDNLGLRPWVNVLHWTFGGGPPSDSDLVTVASQIASMWASNMAPEAPSPTTLTKVTVTDLSSNTAAGGEWLGSHPGTRGDDSIPANASVLVSYPVGMRWQGGHPRTYLFVGGNADLKGAAEWSDLFTAEAQTHWRAFLNQMAIISVGTMSLRNMVTILYYGHGGPYIEGTKRVNPIVLQLNQNTAITQQEMASQRRRIGRGQKR